MTPDSILGQLLINFGAALYFRFTLDLEKPGGFIFPLHFFSFLIFPFLCWVDLCRILTGVLCCFRQEGHVELVNYVFNVLKSPTLEGGGEG